MTLIGLRVENQPIIRSANPSSQQQLVNRCLHQRRAGLTRVNHPGQIVRGHATKSSRLEYFDNANGERG